MNLRLRPLQGRCISDLGFQFCKKSSYKDLEFLKPWKSKAKDSWEFERLDDNETKVIWQNNGELPWPIARLMGPAINKNLSHQFGIGLENLKKLCES